MNDIDRTTIDNSMASARFSKRLAIGFWVFLGIVFALFLNKVNQTSDWALQYSRQTQEEVGEWTLAMFAIFIIALICSASASASGKRFRAQLERYLAQVRSRLAQAREHGDTAAQVDAESELRRLEPFRGMQGATTPVALSNPVATTRAGTEDRYDRLTKLKQLLDDGVLNQAEFDRERERILAEP